MTERAEPFLGLAPGAKNFVFLGEAGSGKSEIAVNLAVALAQSQPLPVHLFDLDMTKPLFRTRDLGEKVEAAGVILHFEEQFMDAPTTTGGVRRLLQDEGCYTVLDVGGDYIGARAIGGYAPLLNRPETALCYVMNPFRPWSMTLEHIDKVLGETLGVSHLRLDRMKLIGNPNLGPNTTAQDVEQGRQTLVELVAPYKPLDLFCVEERLYEALKARFPHPLVPLRLYLTYPWEERGAG